MTNPVTVTIPRKFVEAVRDTERRGVIPIFERTDLANAVLAALDSAPDAPAAAGHSVELRERAADAAERLDGLSCALLMPHASSIGRGLPLTIGVFVGDDRIATFDGVEFCQDLVSVCHVLRRPDDSGAEDNNGE